MTHPHTPGIQPRWRRLWWIIIISLIVLLIAGATLALAYSSSPRYQTYVLFCLYGLPSEQDFNESEAIVNRIVTVHHFTRNSVSAPEKPPVFSIAGSRLLLTQPAVVQVYEVRDRTDQDKIAVAIKDLLLDYGSKRPVDLLFYDRENWPPVAGHRGQETLLRRIYITRNSIREK
jgi:hypothetical protein